MQNSWRKVKFHATGSRSRVELDFPSCHHFAFCFFVSQTERVARNRDSPFVSPASRLETNMADRHGSPIIAPRGKYRLQEFRETKRLVRLKYRLVRLPVEYSASRLGPRDVAPHNGCPGSSKKRFMSPVSCELGPVLKPMCGVTWTQP